MDLQTPASLRLDGAAPADPVTDGTQKDVFPGAGKPDGPPIDVAVDGGPVGDGPPAVPPPDAASGDLNFPNDDGLDAALVVDAEDAPVVTPSLGANGKACLHSGQCQSGFCASGICCDEACGGPCESCRVSGQEGSCVAVPAGEDPGDSCARDDPSTCGFDGTCDGIGACRRYPTGTQCTPATCVGSTEYAARICDGQGVCLSGSTRSCAPLTCQGASCRAGCLADTDCQTGLYCDGGVCRGKLAAGTSCAFSQQCETGFCVDGVCCSTSCGQKCFSCKLPGAEGECLASPRGQDPRSECVAEPAPTCGRAGGCDGSGSCLLHDRGTECAPGICNGATWTPASTCNGIGACVAGAPESCGGYLCNGGVCSQSCGSSLPCATGYTCQSQICVMDVGGGTSLALVVDDFNDSSLTKNNLGGDVTWDNQEAALVSGEHRFKWNGVGVFQDFLESFRASWCEFDTTAYSKLRFKMRATVAGKRVNVFVMEGTGACKNKSLKQIGTATLGTAMTTYEFSLTAVDRKNLLFFELGPQSVDGTTYYLDTLELVP